MSASKEQLLAPRLTQKDVELEGVGSVRVRGLSRREALDISGTTDFEAHLVSLGMVEPAMTPEDVQAWQQACLAGELDQVVKAISELSGLNKGAEKSAYKSDGEH